jgi:hypothetical protein
MSKGQYLAWSAVGKLLADLEAACDTGALPTVNGR